MKMRIRQIISLFMIALFLLAGRQIAQAQEAPGPAFDENVNKAIEDWEVPGLAIAIIKNDRIVFAKG